MQARPLESSQLVTELDLIAGAIRKDEGAVREIIRRYNQRLYRLARSILRDDSEAEDALQEAYLRAFSQLASFRGEAAFGTWLGRIVLNEALGAAAPSPNQCRIDGDGAGHPFSARQPVDRSGAFLGPT
jgi:hypothetical protein